MNLWKFIGRNRMKQQLDAFLLSENKKHCLTSTQVEMFSVSEEPKSDGQKGKCYLIENTEEGILKVSNASGKIVFLLAIDDCIFLSSDGKRCDCAIFDDKAFYFIEIKDCKAKRQSERRKEAIEQLKSTLEFFIQEQQFNFENYQLNVQICFRSSKKPRPDQVTTRQNNEVYFLDNFGANLCEGNEIKL